MIGTSPTTKRIALLPNHVAIIMDGNGRWAEKQGLPRLEGHRAGVENIRPIIECLDEYRIRCVTLYAFSTENWDRPEDEINGLLYLLEEALDKEVPKLHKRGPQLAIRKAIELTKNNTGITFSFAFNYGGRIEILDAVRCIIAKGIPPENIDENLFNSYLYTASLPNVDLLIRTGGELRISNFLLWQAAYSEYYFTEVLWPDFDRKEVEKALIAYSQRQRRFGGL
jgi:undecaprenyl diphosphate synthase